MKASPIKCYPLLEDNEYARYMKVLEEGMLTWRTNLFVIFVHHSVFFLSVINTRGGIEISNFYE